MYAIIGTWKMSYEGIKSAFGQLAQGEGLNEAIATAVMSVEDDPRYISVGYGGLPARDGRVTLDAAYMDGQTLRFGGVMCAEGIRNPIRAAMQLSSRKQNCLLAGKGAEEFALSAGLELRDMRTQNALMRWRKALNEESEKLEAYQGHDTVCVIGLDQSGRMGVGTSTSGLFMKMPGRVGDTAIIGSGFYCDARYGGAAATGLGEDIMRGCLSYDTVSLMRRGASPQEACDEALHSLRTRMRELNETDGGMSLIAMDPGGRFGAATTVDLFPFAVGREGEGTSLYLAGQGEKTTEIRRAKDEDIGNIASD
jgi:isoaspartyl peptidase/L-asparaginase-like protein (Ntn-hydrolase superfamily)